MTSTRPIIGLEQDGFAALRGARRMSSWCRRTGLSTLGHRVALHVVCAVVTGRGPPARRRRFTDWTSRASPGSKRATLAAGRLVWERPGATPALVEPRRGCLLIGAIGRNHRQADGAMAAGASAGRDRHHSVRPHNRAGEMSGNSSFILISACTRSTFGRMLARQHRDLGAGAVAQRQFFDTRA